MRTSGTRHIGAGIGAAALIAMTVIGAGACDKADTADRTQPLSDPTTTSWMSAITSAIESYITTTVGPKLTLPVPSVPVAVRG